jgi:parallel beta-helix repeat protein
MTSGTVDNSQAGFVQAEQVTLTTTPAPAGATYVWGLASPTSSAPARAFLSSTTAASPTLVPDVAGDYSITCVVNSTTTYVLRITVAAVVIADAAQSAIRMPPVLNATIPTPSASETLFHSSDSSRMAVKDSAAAVNLLAYQSDVTKVTTYDAVVAASGADYTSVAAAFAAGKQNVFVRSGTYVETANVTLPANGVLQGESDVNIVFTGGTGVVVDGSGGTQVTAGTISYTNGSTAITGSGTNFNNLTVGDFIKIDSAFYEVDTITDATNLVLTNAYQGPSASGQAWLGQTMISSPTIRNCTIVGDGTNNGVYFRAVQACVLSEFGVTGCSIGLHLVDCGTISVQACSLLNNASDGVKLDDCVGCGLVHCNVNNNGGCGVNIVNGNSIYITACKCTNNDVDGVCIGTTASNCSIIGSVIECNNAKGIDVLTGVSNIAIGSCNVNSNGDIGIDIDGSECAINNCTVTSNGGDGIEGSDDGLIQGNHVASNTGSGISLKGDAGSLVDGNHVHDNGSIGIEVDGPGNDDSVVTNNRVDNNTGNGIDIDANSSRCVVSDNSVTSNAVNINNNESTTQFGISAAGNAVTGDLLYFDGSNWVRLAAGTAGHHLTSNGPGVAPSWQA